MQPHKSSVQDLFSIRKQYAVPLFQRRYVWSQEKQWQPLWEDVARRAESLLTPQGAKQRSHFLGAIVTMQIAKFGLHVPAAEVIDGQQRLTTLQVLLTALQDVFLERKHVDLSTALAGLTRNHKPHATEEDAFKLWPTNQDRAAFRDVMEAGGWVELERRHPVLVAKGTRKPSPRPRLIEAYLFFDEAISDWLDQAEAPEAESARATALYTALTSHFHLVHIELEIGEDPQDIFEALNGRSEPLLPSDLIKNFLFRNAGDQAEALHAAHWLPFDVRQVDPAAEGSARRTDTAFWSQNQRQGRFNRSRLDLFLFHYTVLSAVKDIAIGDLFRAFQDWWASGPRNIERELQQIRLHADVFADLLVPSGDTPIARLGRRLHAIDTTAVYPLLLFLLGRGRSRVKDLDPILVDLESYLVRRATCGLTNKNYNSFFLGLLRRLDGRYMVDHATFRAELGSSQEETSRWPSDEEFRRAWLEAESYSRLGPKRTAMVLLALEDALRPKHGIEVEVRSQLTVEHVMPKKWEAHWPLPPTSSPEEAESAKAHRERVLHTFGNLTLLTGPLNSSLQNASFQDRRPEIAQRALLNLNVVFQNPDAVWDEAAIRSRGEELFSVAARIWPGPASA